MNDNISIIYSRDPKERIPLLINFLYEYGIKQKKKVYFQSFDLNPSYYLNRLVSLISKIDFKLIESYMFPLGIKSNKLKNQKINTKEFISALEIIRQSNLIISGSKMFESASWLDYLFDLKDLDPYQVIIIDDFPKFLEECHEDLTQVKKTIERYSDKYKAMVILLTNNEKLKKRFFNMEFC